MKLLPTFALIVGLSSTLWLTLSLTLNINNPTLCWYESNVLIRTLEISMGVFASIFLLIELWSIITNKNQNNTPQPTTS